MLHVTSYKLQVNAKAEELVALLQRYWGEAFTLGGL